MGPRFQHQAVSLWDCVRGAVVLWCCGAVVLWCCGAVVLWCCGVASCSLLSTFLPYPVKDKDGNAKWDPAKEELVVTLPIIRSDPFS